MTGLKSPTRVLTKIYENQTLGCEGHHKFLLVSRCINFNFRTLTENFSVKSVLDTTHESCDITQGMSAEFWPEIETVRGCSFRCASVVSRSVDSPIFLISSEALAYKSIIDSLYNTSYIKVYITS